MKIACYSTCGPNVCSFFCSPSLSLSPLAFAIFYSLLMFASFLFYIFQYFLHCHCVHGIGGPPIFICGHFFVHNLLNTCFELRPSKESGLPGVTPWGVLSLTTALTQLGAVPRQRPTQHAITSCPHLRLGCSWAF